MYSNDERHSPEQCHVAVRPLWEDIQVEKCPDLEAIFRSLAHQSLEFRTEASGEFDQFRFVTFLVPVYLAISMDPFTIDGDDTYLRPRILTRDLDG